jgi:hypothetical protein
VASSKFEYRVNQPGERAERGDMLQICCNLRHIFLGMDEFARERLRLGRNLRHNFFERIPAWKKQEEVDVRDGMAECIEGFLL